MGKFGHLEKDRHQSVTKDMKWKDSITNGFSQSPKNQALADPRVRRTA
ncbi:MAG: hypothetical protein NTX75_11515 [Proteobacteria bacterium]|nr:hypothetical protein [Pseudomonadota bacterium]